MTDESLSLPSNLMKRLILGKEDHMYKFKFK